jgi:hypothetical protein
MDKIGVFFAEIRGCCNIFEITQFIINERYSKNGI